MWPQSLRRSRCKILRYCDNYETKSANKRVQRTRHKVSGPLTRDVGYKYE